MSCRTDPISGSSSQWSWASAWSALKKFLSPDFLEFIECCERHEVQFLIVGGYAVDAHGHPRATKDLDIWVLIDPVNAERLVGALEDFGMGSVGLTLAEFMEPDIAIQLGHPPLRIDLLTSVSGVTFEDCWTNRVFLDVGGVEASFISLPELIINKRAAGRGQDLVDVDALQDRPET